jgi:hypothetical protein
MPWSSQGCGQELHISGGTSPAKFPVCRAQCNPTRGGQSSKGATQASLRWGYRVLAGGPKARINFDVGVGFSNCIGKSLHESQLFLPALPPDLATVRQSGERWAPASRYGTWPALGLQPALTASTSPWLEGVPVAA